MNLNKNSIAKKTISMILSLLMVFSCMSVIMSQDVINASAWDGTTTSAAPYSNGAYQIGTAEQLAWFSAQVNSGKTTYKAVLTADIDMTGQAFTPIGYHDRQYAGTFDGQNHTISNLYITTTSVDRGLFGKTAAAAVIKNVNLSVVRCLTSRDYAGTIAGVIVGSTIQNCHVTGVMISASGKSIFGGIVGQAEGTAKIIDCTVEGTASYKTILGAAAVGGIVGKTTGNATITNCDVKNMNITATRTKDGAYDGGIVGQATAAATISGCDAYNVTIDVKSGYAGGVAGWATACTFKDCTVTGIYMTSTTGSVGGFIGETSSSVVATNCSVKPIGTTRNTIKGTDRLAGFTGRSNNIGTYTNCSAEGFTITSTNTDCGGFVGRHDNVTTYTSCYAKDITITGASTYRGGFIGYPTAKMTATDCYAENINLTGTQNVGGFAGEFNNASLITKCYVSSLVINASNTQTGGFVGNICSSLCTVQYCYVYDANIKSTSNTAGGFVGYIRSSNHNISECYVYTSALSCTSTYVGTFAGRRDTGNLSSDYAVTTGTLPLVGSSTAGKAGTVTGTAAITLASLSDGTLTSKLNAVTDVWAQSEDNTHPVISTNAVAPSLVNGYYEIGNAYQLEWFSRFVNDGNLTVNAKLTADIHLNNKDFTPIGNDSKQYGGIFDGQNFTIYDLKITTLDVDRGLFGKTSANAVIKNINLENVSISGARDFAGSVAGVIVGSDIINCHVTGVNIDMSTKSKAGGIVGQVEGTAPTIQNCSVTGVTGMNTISTANYSGGIIAYINTAVTVTGCTVSDMNLRITSQYAGGIFAGSSESASTFTECNVNNLTIVGTSTGQPFIGGFSGVICKGANVQKCGVVTVNITSSSTNASAYIGGFSGISGWGGANTIRYCYATGVTIKSPSAGNVGGFLGNTNNANHGISECYANVVSMNSTKAYVGTFIGNRSSGTFTDNFANKVGSYPVTGSGTAYSAGTTTGITVITATQVANGELCDKLNDVTEIWQQAKEDYVAGYPEIGNADPPSLVNGYYEIYNSFQLRWFRDTVNNGSTAIKGKLMADINLKSRDWTPIGNDSRRYTGTFDGNGFTISNLSISTTSYDRGFFGQTTNATIKNLNFDTVVMTGNRSYSAAVVGVMNGGTVSGCNVSNITVTTPGYANVGGIVGYARTSTSRITDCTVKNAKFTASKYVGGIVAELRYASTVSGCTAENITVTATDAYIGGLIGFNYQSDIDDCHVKGVYITSTSTNAGGFIGESQTNTTTIDNCTVEPLNSVRNTVKANDYTGGFIGRVYSGTMIINKCSVTDTNANGTGYVGGFIGETNTTLNVTECSVNNGSVSGTQFNGGFIGRISNGNNTFTKSNVNTISVTSTGTPSYAGGFIGYINECMQTVDQCNVYDATIRGTANIGGFSSSISGASKITKSSVVNATITSTSVYTNGDYAIGGFIGIAGWGNANTVQYCFTQNLTINANSLNVGGFIGKMDNVAHNITECYANAVSLNSTKTYAGTFIGRKDSGITTDCYSAKVGSLPTVGSATAGVMASGANVIAVNSSDVKDGSLTDELAGITAVWKQHNDDTTNGWPEIGEAALPELVNGYYEIYNSFQLRWFRDKVNAGSTAINAKLMANIDLKNRAWTPIGNSDSTKYTGTFDGNGFTVSNVSVTSTSYDRGFFGQATNLTVKNLTLDGVTVAAGRNCAGGLVGVMNGGTVNNVTIKNVTINNGGYSYNSAFAGYVRTNTASFTNCNAENVKITGAQYNGGMIGKSEIATTFSGCNVQNITINATSSFSAGFIGYTFAVNASDCHVNGVYITSTSSNNGGFIGESQNAASTVQLCTVEPLGTVRNSIGGTQFLGGFIGRVYSGSMNATEARVFKTDVTGTSSYIGGFVGENNTSLTAKKCSANDSVIKGVQYVAGFIGDIDSTASFTSCDTGTITATSTGNESFIAGFAGFVNAKSTFDKCNVNGITAQGTQYIGGFSSNLLGGSTVFMCGVNNASLTSTLTSESRMGGFVGVVGWDNPNTIEYCYANNVTIRTSGTNAGGFIGIMDNAKHNIVECYSNSVLFSSTSQAYKGTFIGQRLDGYVSNCFASTCQSLPLVGSSSANVAGNTKGTTAVAPSEVSNGTLASKLADITCVWEQLNGDNESGYPVIDINAGGCTKNGEGYYEIYNEYQLECFMKIVNAGEKSANAILKADIDLAGKRWTPIGSESVQYGGKFDGNGFTISNLYIDTTDNFVGLFGYTSATSEIKNLKIVGAYITTTGSHAAVFTGMLNGKAVNCDAENVKISSGSYVGTIAGENTVSTQITSSDVKNVTINGAEYVGGIIGRSSAAATVTDCNVTDITLSSTERYVGGLIGYAYSSTIDNCHVKNIKITKTTGNAGGFIGESQGGTQTTITNCSVDAPDSGTNSISGGEYLGGAIGRVYSGSMSVKNSPVSKMTITATGSYAGGFIGENNAAMTSENCNVTDLVITSSTTYVGGFMGFANAKATVSGGLVSNIKLTATECIGGFAGGISSGSDIQKVGVVNAQLISTVPSTSNSTTGGFVGLCGWKTANTITWCYAANISFTAVGEDVGGFVGKIDTSAHVIKECYTYVTSISNTEPYVGTFSGYKSSGTFTDCYAAKVGNLPSMGSNVAFVENTENAVTAVTADDVKSGNLTYTLCDITDMWKQHNNDTVSGYPEIGQADPPSLVNGYYEINNAYQLRWFAKYVNGTNTAANGKLMADISLNNRAWTPIGNSDSYKYTGTFDGNGFTVSNIAIPTNSYDRGFFGQTSYATIKNLTLTNMTVTSSRDCVGGIVGVMNGGTVDSCHVNNLTITNTGNSNNGGIVGYVKTSTATIKNSTVSTVKITGAKSNGGLVGGTESTAAISFCTATDVTITASNSYAGGLVGYAKPATITDSDVAGVYITSTAGNAGGLIGESQGSLNSVKNCNVTSINHTNNIIKGTSYLGGIIGRAYSGSFLAENSSVINTDITGTSQYVGGFIGENDISATFTNGTVNNISVKGSQYVGGFIGCTDSTASMTGCTVTDADVTGTSTESYIGGFSGYLAAKTTMTSCTVRTATLSGPACIGGFTGNIGNASVLEKCSVVGATITSTRASGSESNVGGFAGVVGWDNANSVSWCYAAKTAITANGTNVGGFIGKMNNSAHTIKECYASASITGTTSYAGSFVGRKDSGTFTDCYAQDIANIGISGSAVTGVEEVSAAEVADGTLRDELNNITGIWQQNSDGYPEMGKADEPVMNADGYYEIHTAYQLRWFASYANTTNISAKAKLMANINLNNREWAPIGNHDKQYAGVFDGNGFTVSGVLINTTSIDRGFFGKTSASAVIKNLTLDGVTCKTVRDYTGAISGAVVGSTITNCHVKNADFATSKGYVGGMFGQIEGAATVKNCSVENSTLSGTTYVGGLAGRIIGIGNISDITIKNITETGTGNNIGGLTGKIEAANNISNCNVEKAVLSGVSYVAGLVGYHSAAMTYNNCHVKDVNITSTSSSAAGFIGEAAAQATYTNCTVTKTGTDNCMVKGVNYTGGFAGRIYSGDNIFTSCSVDGMTVNSTGNYAGGFIGENNSKIAATSCMVKNSSVKSASNAAGFIGNSSSTASYAQCFTENVNVTAVSGEYAGGFAGYIDTKATVNECYAKNVTVSGVTMVGGFAGGVGNGTEIRKSYVLTAEITASSTQARAGGFIGILGWDSANTVQYCYAADVAITSNGTEVGGFFGNINNANHYISECYAYATEINDSKAYVGTFTGVKQSGTVENCFAASVNALPITGSSVAGAENTSATGVKSTSAAEVKNGTLTTRMNDVTSIWLQHNNDKTNGWPEIDPSAVEPELVNGYYEINTAYQLEWYTKFVNAGNTTAKAKLMTDIDMQNKTWTPIGSNSQKFAGTFDGNSKTLSNIKVTATSNDAGLFGSTDTTSVIKNLNLVNVSVTSTNPYVGGLAGVNRGTISGCNLTNVTIKGSANVGGAVGICQNNAVVEKCNVTNGTVTSTNGYCGGVIGNINTSAGIVRNNTANNLTISASQRAGGIAGDTDGGVVNMTNCFTNNCTISAECYAGGVVFGFRGASSMINCGTTDTTITTTTTGVAENGGLIGYLTDGSSVSNAFAKNVTIISSGSRNAGLVANANNGILSESYVFARVKGGSESGTLIGLASTVTTANNTYVASKGGTAIGSGTATAPTPSDAASIAAVWFPFFEEQSKIYTSDVVMAMGDSDFEELYDTMMFNYNIVRYYDDSDYAGMKTATGFGIADVHSFMETFLLRYNANLFREYLAVEDNPYAVFFTDELLATDITTLTTSDLINNYYYKASEVWNAVIDEFAAITVKTVLGDERYNQITGFIDGCYKEIVNNRLEKELDAVISCYNSEGEINMMNFRKTGNALKAVETLVYTELSSTLDSTIIAKYNKYLAVYEEYNLFITKDAFTSFETGTVEYPTRVVRDDDVARDESPKEDYTLNSDKMQSVVKKIDNVLEGDDFAELLDLDEPLEDTIKTLLNEKLYTNDIINTLIDSIYVMICDELTNAIENYGSVTVLGIKISFRGKAKDVINSLMDKFGLYLQPEDLAKVLDSSKYGKAIEVLKAAGNDWHSVNLDDPDAPGYLDWGIADKDSFIDAMGNMFRGVYPAARALFTDHAFDQTATADVITGCDLVVAIKIDAVNAYNDTLVPLLESLGIKNLTPVSEFNEYTTVDQFIDAIAYPLFNWVENTVATAPLSTIAELLPNLACYLEFGYLEQWLQSLATSINYNIKAKVGTSWAHTTISVVSGDLDFSVYELLTEKESAILHGADLYSIEGLLDVVLDKLDVDVKLPVSSNAYLASLGTMQNIASATNFGSRYYIKANSGDVMYVVLHYLLTAAGNKEFITQLLQSFADEGEEVKLDGALEEIINNVGASPENALAAIVELCCPQEYDMTPIDFSNKDNVSVVKVQYNEHWTKEKAEYVTANLDEFIDDMLALLGLEPLDKMLSDMVGGELYLNSNLTKIVVAIRDLVKGIGGYEKILGLLDIDISSWDNIEDGHDWGFADGDKDGFLNALCNALSPVNSLLEFVLADKDINVLDGQITAKGYEGYKYGIIPILEALGCDSKDIASGEKYLSDVKSNGNSLIKDIIVPIFNLLDRVYKDPANTIFDILPNIIYFVECGALTSSIENTLHSVFVLLDTARPVYDLELDLDFDVDELVNDLINNAVGDIGLKLPDSNVLLSLLAGSVSEKTSVNGEKIYQIDSANADLVTVILRYVIDAVFYGDNEKVLTKLIIDKAGLAEKEQNVLTTVMSTFDSIATSENGADKLLAVLYYIYYGGFTATSQTLDFLNNFNSSWQYVLKLLQSSDSSIVSGTGSAIADFLNKNFEGIFDSDGLASKGLMSFFQKIIDWFKKVIAFFKGLFSKG